MDETCDRLRVDYCSSVPAEARRAVVDAVRATLPRSIPLSLYTTEHYDKVSAAWSIDVTTHDPSEIHPYTDSQIADLLKSIAAERGVTLSSLIAAAKVEASK